MALRGEKTNLIIVRHFGFVCQGDHMIIAEMKSRRTVFKLLCFRSGLVWALSLTVERKLRLQISRAQCGRCLTNFSNNL